MTEAVMEARTREAMPTNRTCFAEFTRKYSEQLGELSTHFIEGYATTDTEIYGIRLTLDATKGAMTEYDQWRNVRFMHDMNPVGVVRDWRVDNGGLWVRVQVLDEAAWEKVENGLVTGFSIGFGFELTDEIIDQWLDGDTITPKEYWLTEVSIVDRPADTECSFSIVRRAEDANTGDANAREIVTAVRAALTDFFRGFGKRPQAEGGEELADKDKERDLTAEVERLTTERDERDRALVEVREELAARDAAVEEERKAAAVDFARELAEAKVIEPANAELWIARHLADQDWAAEHAEALRGKVDTIPKAERTKEGRPADHVPGEEGASDPIAERARALQKEDKELSWEAAVQAAAREVEKGA